MLKKYHLTGARIVILSVLAIFFGLFLIYPLWYVLVRSLTAHRPDGSRYLTFAFYGLFFKNPIQFQAILNSFKIATAATLMTTAISLPLAFIMVRYEFRGKSIMNGLLLVPMILPPFVGAIAMNKMFAARGAVNLLLQHLHITDAGVNWFGSGFLGIVIIEVLHLYPVMYLNVAAALANVDPSMHEAAKNAGASGFTLFRKITFPLMLPGYFAGASIVFIWAYTDLGTPLIFNYSRVVPVQIFNRINDMNNPMAYVMVVFLILLTLGIFYLSKLMVGEKRYDMMARGHTGAISQQATPMQAHFFRAFIIGLVAAAVIPHIGVILLSVAENWTGTILPSTFSGEFYGKIFANPITASSIRNSMFLSVLSTFVDILLGVVIAWLLTRTLIPGRNILDTLAMLPLAIPGIIMAFGYLGAYSGTILDASKNPFPLLIIAYSIRRLPYMVRSAYAGFQQTHVSLEEAARNVGATPLKSVMKITVPLIVANLIAGAILCFSFAMLEVSDSLILANLPAYYPITKAIYYVFQGIEDGKQMACAMGVLGMALLGVSLFFAGKFLGRRMGEIFRTR